MNTILINQTKYYYELHGQTNKPALVLISGLWSDHSYWLPLLPALSDDFEILIFDNRAIGKTSDNTPDHEFSLHDMADDTAELIKQVFPAMHVNIIGQSMGGAIAQIIAANYPKLVRKLMLFNTTPKWSHATIEGLRSLLLSAKEKTSFEQNFAGYLAWIFGEKFLANPVKVTELRNTLLTSEAIQTLADQERQFQALTTFTGIDLSHIQCPTLIGYGPEDKICAISEAKALCDTIPHAELHQFIGAHSPLLEDFYNVVAIIKKFLLQNN